MLLWAKSIACYVIAVSLLMGILPEGNHKKYVKFFTGIILSLLLLSPIMKFNSFDTLLANYYREGVAKVLDEQRNQLEGVEQQHLEKIIEQTVSVMGYSLRNVVYEKKSGEIAKLIVYVKEENEAFEVPVVLVDKIECIEDVIIQIEDEEEREGEGMEQEHESELVLSLKSALKAMCGVDVEVIIE